MGYTKGLQSNNHQGLFSWLKKSSSIIRNDDIAEDAITSPANTKQYEYDELKKKLIKVENKNVHK